MGPDEVKWTVEPPEGHPVSAESKVVQQLFLSLDTRVTCPKCTAKFSLQEGFARQSLERLEQSTQGALEAVREGERAEARKHAQQIAAQRDKTLRDENAQLQQLLQDQSQGHAKALHEVRALTEQAMAPQVAALRAQLAESQSRIDAATQREAELAAREQGLEARVVQEAQTRAQAL